MNFEKAMASNPARLVIQWRLDESGVDQFQWGVVGQIPILNLIGDIIWAQARLSTGAWIARCDDGTPSFVLAYAHGSRGEATCYLNPAIPLSPLVGMMDMIRTMLAGSHAAAHQASNRVERVLMPDGTPFKRINGEQ